MTEKEIANLRFGQFMKLPYQEVWKYGPTTMDILKIVTKVILKKVGIKWV